MATDEGVLGRSLSSFFSRDGSGRLNADSASKLYTVYDYENGATRMNMIFRDHTVSDLIGFVYSGMPGLATGGSTCSDSFPMEVCTHSRLTFTHC